jgi:hemoglobin
MQLDAPEILDEAQRVAIEIAISDCVQRFYAKGLADPLLGPVFTSAIPDLPAHLEIIKNFWSHSLLGTERYQGHPYPVHTSLRISGNISSDGLNCSLRAHGKRCRNHRLARQSPRQAIMAQCFQAGIFPFTGPDGKPSRLPPH